jgi:hypothetical protein
MSWGSAGVPQGIEEPSEAHGVAMGRCISVCLIEIGNVITDQLVWGAAKLGLWGGLPAVENACFFCAQ